jgi:hypothetical protein
VQTVLLIAATVALGAILCSAYVLTRRDRKSAIAPASELQRGIGDDIIRNDYIDKASEAEKRGEGKS